MCRYCEMKPHRSGGLEWMQGKEYESGDTTAFILHCKQDGEWLLCAKWSDHFGPCASENTSVTIAHCPWCGRRLGVDA